MGAIAVSKEDEGQIGVLMRELGVKSKAQVVRAALRTLRERLDQEKLRAQIRESVQQCAEADRREHRLLAPGGVPRHPSPSSTSTRGSRPSLANSCLPSCFSPIWCLRPDTPRRLWFPRQHSWWKTRGSYDSGSSVA